MDAVVGVAAEQNFQRRSPSSRSSVRYLSASELLAMGRSLDARQYLTLLYDQLFARVPQLGEADGHLGQIETGAASRLALIRTLANSSEGVEACRVYYHWRDLLHPDADFLPDAYLFLLGRGIDDVGRAFLQEKIDAGIITRAGALLSLAASDEYRVDAASVTLDGLTEASTKPLVNIVVGDRGWALERLAREIEQRLPYVTIGDSTTDAPIQYFMPYTARRQTVGKINVALFTHVEQAPVLRDQFTQACQDMDLAIHMSEKYRSVVELNSAKSVRITPGVDPDEFPIAPVRIGVCGRAYGSGRKGEALVAALMGVPGIEWHFTGSGWPGPSTIYRAHEMHRFYGAIHYLLIPSLYEGEPMPALEALACGRPLIAPPVGFVEALPHIPYPAGDELSLRRILVRLVEERTRLRRSVEHFTWDSWAQQHHTQFQTLLGRRAVSDGARFAASASTPNDTSLPSAAIILHSPEGRGRAGGPSRRAFETATALEAAGCQAMVHYDVLPSPADADIAHVFNVWEPRSAVELLERAKRRGLGAVFSSIFVDRAVDRVPEAANSIFNDALTFEEIDAGLLGLPEIHAQAIADRRATVDRLLPGFVADTHRMLSLTDHLVLTSKYELDLLQDYGLHFFPPHSIVHNAPSARLLGAPSTTNLPPVIAKGGYILCVGHLEPRKNQLLLLHACRDLDRPLVFVGSGKDSPYGKLIQRYATPWTHFMNHINDEALLRSVYDNAAAFVLPSWAEGAPLSALEAASFGVPLVLSSQSSEQEYFGEYACYCDPWSPGSIRAAVERALQENDRGARERRAAFVKANYNYRRVSAELIEIYRAATGKSRYKTFLS